MAHAALVRAERLGGKRVMGPERAPSGLVVGHFTDPEGNLIGVAGRRPGLGRRLCAGVSAGASCTTRHRRRTATHRGAEPLYGAVRLIRGGGGRRARALARGVPALVSTLP